MTTRAIRIRQLRAEPSRLRVEAGDAQPRHTMISSVLEACASARCRAGSKARPATAPHSMVATRLPEQTRHIPEAPCTSPASSS